MRYFVLAVAVASLFAAAPAAATTIRIDEARVRLEMTPGETKAGQIHISNPTDGTVTVKVYTEDWEYLDSGNGDKDFFPAGTLPNTASPWITYNPSLLVIEPFGKQTVDYTIAVPSAVDGGTRYSIMFFETSLGVGQNEEGASVSVAGRIGSLFYVDIAGTVRHEGKIELLEFTPGKGNRPSVIRPVFKNTGNTSLTVEGEFMLIDAEGAAKARGKLNPIYSREGSTTSQETEWPGRLAPGTYDGVFTFDLGDGELLVEEKKISIE
ncbi:MAG: hypothetical protein KBD07_03020 [Candidatus Omnitrophica bacterium]|jgi:hypothetical protein|nr:hypothetical protein [Candidatus Omnitrophota bacterium]